MRKASWVVLLILGPLLSTAGSAEDIAAPDTIGQTLSQTLLSTDALPDLSSYASRLELRDSVDAVAYPAGWREPMPQLNFREHSALARISKLRNLSFLTLAEAGRSRLFLGVNEDGLLGLHFNALPRGGEQRYLEMARMPYLSENETAGDQK